MIYILSHYRSQMNFTWKSLEQARKNRKTIENFLQRLRSFEAITTPDGKKVDINKFRNDFENAMDDDLNTPLALSVLLSLITETNTFMDNKTLYNTDEINRYFEKACKSLGITTDTTTTIPDDILAIAKRRDISRKNKDYKLSDILREEILNKGYDIKDSSDGFKLQKL